MTDDSVYWQIDEDTRTERLKWLSKKHGIPFDDLLRWRTSLRVMHDPGLAVLPREELEKDDW